MAKPLNFNNVKKRFLTVTLADENETVLQIGTPTKAIMDDVMALNDLIEDINESEEHNVTEDVYETCAKIMSRNKTGKVITADFLADILDFEDVIIFFNAYVSFVSEIANSKN